MSRASPAPPTGSPPPPRWRTTPAPTASRATAGTRSAGTSTAGTAFPSPACRCRRSAWRPGSPRHLAGTAAALAPDGYIGWGEIGAALRNKPALIPPLGGYDAYLPPDYGWQAPIAYPVQRVPVGYTKWYPNQWYGLPGSQKPRVAPVAFMPTDTSQLGYYHQQVPTWQPLPPGSLPGAPDPRVLHHRTCPAGPDLGVYGGTYPNEPRAGLIGLRDRLHGAHDHHGETGGTIVTDPACPADAMSQAPVISDPLPTSTQSMDGVPAAPAPSFAPPAGDPLPAAPAI